jgi:hypothetical protein
VARRDVVEPSSDDWRINDLQLEYGDRWTPALRARIRGQGRDGGVG